MIRVCFVCLGNICRSPTAESVFRHAVRQADLEQHIDIDSAGTAGHHSGESPDPRARAAGARRGIRVTGSARRFERGDFDRFDYVLAMDGDNLHDLRALQPPSFAGKLRLLRSFDPRAEVGAGVPDPYYGDEAGFDEVVSICERACQGLLESLRREHGL